MKNPNHELITMKDMFMFEKKIKKKENGDDIIVIASRRQKNKFIHYILYIHIAICIM